jgi:chemotaxis protein MotB
MEEPETSHDRWLVSYADFMTLLMGFFVVLFASSYRDNQVIKQISQAIHIGFQNLGAFAGGQNPTGVAYKNLSPKISTARPSTLGRVPDAGSSVPADPKAGGSPTGASPVNIAQLRTELESAVGQELRNHEVVMSETPEGFVVSLKDLGFFNSGEAALLPGASEKIERIAAVLLQHGLNLRVEGHSDDQPIHTAEFRSNWELSTARAMTVVLFLVDKAGFDPTKISVAGYGQYRPIADNTTVEGRRMNRRVDLVVVAAVAKPQQ